MKYRCKISVNPLKFPKEYAIIYFVNKYHIKHYDQESTYSTRISERTAVGLKAVYFAECRSSLVSGCAEGFGL